MGYVQGSCFVLVVFFSSVNLFIQSYILSHSNVMPNIHTSNWFFVLQVNPAVDPSLSQHLPGPQVLPGALDADSPVPVINLKDGTRLAGDDAPKRRDLESWLKAHPGYVEDRGASIPVSCFGAKPFSIYIVVLQKQIFTETNCPLTSLWKLMFKENMPLCPFTVKGQVVMIRPQKPCIYISSISAWAYKGLMTFSTPIHACVPACWLATKAQALRAERKGNRLHATLYQKCQLLFTSPEDEHADVSKC